MRVIGKGMREVVEKRAAAGGLVWIFLRRPEEATGLGVMVVGCALAVGHWVVVLGLTEVVSLSGLSRGGVEVLEGRNWMGEEELAGQ